MPSKKQIDLLFKSIRLKIKKEGLQILVSPQMLPQAQLLIVTSRRIGNAPTRNLIKRRIKAIYHEQKIAQAQLDLIFITHPVITTIPFARLSHLIQEAIQEAHKRLLT